MTMKKAFTLLEVNLAIMIMAGGILSILGLYGLGYRENRQSREDVASTAYADAVLSPLVMALSATNVTWQQFNQIRNTPSEEGWGAYINKSTGLVDQDPQGKAEQAWDAVMNAVGKTAKVNTTWPRSAKAGLKAGLVVLHDQDSSVVRLGFRATRNNSELLAMPLFFTEVRFQGKPDLLQEDEEEQK